MAAAYLPLDLAEIKQRFLTAKYEALVVMGKELEKNKKEIHPSIQDAEHHLPKCTPSTLFKMMQFIAQYINLKKMKIILRINLGEIVEVDENISCQEFLEDGK